MPFQIALSGLKAASTSLSTTANNIANVNTTGFKKSRANFVELFATGLQNVASNATGLGARPSSIQQQFAQGSLEFTDNNLDLSLVGGGFFSLRDSEGGGALSYTRAGNFGVNRNGFVVNDQGLRLQAFPLLQQGLDGVSTFNTGSLVDLRLDTVDASPSATQDINVGLNLPSDAIPPFNDPADPDSGLRPFNREDPTTFNNTTSVTIFDSLGVSRTATYYFVKTDVDREWQTFKFVDNEPVETQPVLDGDGNPIPLLDGDGDPVLDADGNPVFQTAPTPVTLTFNVDGGLQAINGDTTVTSYQYNDFPSPPADDLRLNSTFANVTQFGSTFNVNSLQQDGFSSGRLVSIEINPEGVVFARFTNGQSTPLGQLALTNFTNVEGLENVSDTRWAETFESGQALRGPAGSGNIGTVQAGALESANVDLAQELVKMITAQRTFQANAQMISTADSITQTIINIR